MTFGMFIDTGRAFIFSGPAVWKASQNKAYLRDPSLNLDVLRINSRHACSLRVSELVDFTLTTDFEFKFVI